MLIYIVLALMLISVVVSVITGNGDALLSATMSGAQDAVSLCIGLAGTMALWSGLFRIAGKAGLLKILSKWLRPVTRMLFPKETEEQTLGHITTNIVSNMIGIGNAATPAGLAAMRRMGQRSNGKATSAMAVFCVLNGASIQLIPTTVIGMRAAAGSVMPADILIPVWVTSFVSALVGILMIKALARK